MNKCSLRSRTSVCLLLAVMSTNVFARSSGPDDLRIDNRQLADSVDDRCSLVANPGETGMKPSSRRQPPASAALVTSFDFESNDNLDYLFQAINSEAEAYDTSMGVEWLGQPEAPHFVNSSTTGEDVAVNVGDFHIGEATSGSGFTSGYVNGPSHDLKIVYQTISGARQISFTASIGFALYHDPAHPEIDKRRNVRATVKILNPGGRVFYEKVISDDLLASACARGGTFVTKPGFDLPPNHSYFLERCGPLRFDIPLTPGDQEAGPLSAVWHVTTDDGFIFDQLVPLVRLNIDELSSDYPGVQDPVCKSFDASHIRSGFCSLPVTNPAHFLRVSGPSGNQYVFPSSQDPMSDAQFAQDITGAKPGIYVVDAYCEGVRLDGMKLSCGKSGREARFRSEEIAPAPAVARLTEGAAIIFPPARNCYSRDVQSYEIYNGTRKVGTVEAQAFARDGYVAHGLTNAEESFYLVPRFADGQAGRKSVVATASWKPQDFSFTVDHFPARGNPANISVSGNRPRLRGETTTIVVTPAKYPGASETALGFTNARVQAPPLYTKSLNGTVPREGDVPRAAARIAIIDPSEGGPRYEEAPSYDGRSPTQSFWIVSSDLAEKLTEKQLSRALLFFGDPRTLASDHARCLHEEPPISPTPGDAVAPAINLCQCEFTGSSFNCSARTAGHALMVTLPTPEAVLGQALPTLYRKTRKYEVKVGNKPLSVEKNDGLLGDKDWRNWVASRQMESPPLYPRAVQAVGDTSAYAHGLATFDYLRMIAWDAKPGNNLFRPGSDFQSDWISVFNQMFYSRYTKPLKNLAPGTPLRTRIADLNLHAFLVLYALDDVYAHVQGHATTFNDLIFEQSVISWILEDAAEAGMADVWDLITDFDGITPLAKWPGEVIPMQDCGPLGCSTEMAELLPKCDYYVDYNKKFDGYTHEGSPVQGYLRDYALFTHTRAAAHGVVASTLAELHRKNKLLFSEMKPEYGALSSLGDYYALARPAWDAGQKPAPGVPTLQGLRDSVNIKVNSWYCRGKSRHAPEILEHEGAHAVHALRVLYDPTSIAALSQVRSTEDSQVHQARLSYTFGTYLMWTEYRAYRMQYCREKTDYVQGSLCANEYALFDALFFGTRPPRNTVGIPAGLVQKRSTYLELWAGEGLCKGGVCNTISDIIAPLPIYDICNPFTGEKGNCPDLP